MASAEGTGFAVKLPTNSPDLPDLFVHRSLLLEMMPVFALLSVIEVDIEAGQNF